MTADVVVVAGARPNFVKVAPVLRSLEAQRISCSLVHTGQHYDPKMSQVFFQDLRIRTPDHSLEVGSGSHAAQTAAIMCRFDEVLRLEQPKAVVVFGDVNSTVACSLTAAKHGVFVVHVEAGLRSRDWSMPEEINRVVTDRISDLLLAPSDDAAENLLSEGVDPRRIRVVGNVMVDSLFSNLDRALTCPSLLTTGEQYVLVTVHRPSNVDDPATLKGLLEAFAHISTILPVIWPVHPRTKAMLNQFTPPTGVTLCEPLGYLDFVAAEARAAVVLTDSGGVQEETTALGVPCLTLRTTTERPITITEGTNRLVGTDPGAIVAATREVLHTPSSPRRPTLWDGRAGERCAEAISGLLKATDWPRPSDQHGYGPSRETGSEHLMSSHCHDGTGAGDVTFGGESQ